MGTDKVIRFRYLALRSKIKEFCVELMTLSPHLTEAELADIDQEIQKCRQACGRQP